mmetsp:Transcript_18512/g.21313  ORF Transcript_18512/g.21313 Transcript_18512/m.21313 type:complete len:174 (+) Transcript_18512:41-562(+)
MRVLLLAAIFLTLVAQLSGKYHFHIDFVPAQNFWEKHFQPLFKGDGLTKAEQFLEKLKDYAREAFKRDHERKMAEEIAKDFLHKHNPKAEQVKEDVAHHHIHHFNTFACERANEIYHELLKLFELDKEADDVLEMIYKEPEYYGLTYESWKIMTFAKELEKDLDREQRHGKEL